MGACFPCYFYLFVVLFFILSIVNLCNVDALCGATYAVDAVFQRSTRSMFGVFPHAASIVEPHGFSGSLPVMNFLCVVNSVSLFRRIKMFCSVLFCIVHMCMSTRYEELHTQ